VFVPFTHHLLDGLFFHYSILKGFSLYLLFLLTETDVSEFFGVPCSAGLRLHGTDSSCLSSVHVRVRHGDNDIELADHSTWLPPVPAIRVDEATS
jgi:hypothetical protein